MRLVVDTNVFVSGVFFSGPSSVILHAWKEGRVQLVVSPEILDEYRRVGKELSNKYSGVDLEPMLELLAVEAAVVHAPALPESICSDADDDKFLACALASGTKLITSGDKHLLAVSGYERITILKPRAFVEKHLRRG